MSAVCTGAIDLGDNATVEPDIAAGLTDAERAWALHSESLWRRAHEIASSHPGIDPGDVYHALRCLELSPTERLRRGLSRGRLRTIPR